MIRRGCVCLVTDRRQCGAARTLSDELHALERLLGLAVAAGIDLVQIRERDLDAAVLTPFARRVVALVEGTDTTVVVNDRADIAIAVDAGGVHLRGDGPDIDRVRAIGPVGWTLGKSVHTPDEARAHESADYLLFGTVFASGSKPDGAPVQGMDRLADAVTASRSPILAIGGITTGRAVACAAAGAMGVAAIGLFAPVTDIRTMRAIVADLRAPFERASNLLK